MGNDDQSDQQLLTCLECGAKMSLLRRHLRQVHDMTPGAYRTKWGLPDDFELSSSAYSAMREAARSRK